MTAPESKLKAEVSTTSQAETSAPIDMDWLKESLDELQWADVGKWLKDKYKNASGTTVKAIVESLTRSQQEEFIEQVQGRLDIYRAEP